MNRLVFKVVNCLGTIMIILSTFFSSWSLDVRMGEQRPTITANIFQKINIAKLNGNFQKFDDQLAIIVKYFAIALLCCAILVTILSLVEAAIDENHRKLLKIFTLIFAVLVCVCVIVIFVLDIVFVRKNTIVQPNGYTLKPMMENGMYFMIMGGFFNGLFSIYSIALSGKR